MSIRDFFQKHKKLILKQDVSQAMDKDMYHKKLILGQSVTWSLLNSLKEKNERVPPFASHLLLSLPNLLYLPKLKETSSQ